MINFRAIRHLWAFLAVAEEQHFGRAAKRLGMSQPPLTAQIQSLEQALRVKLFERNRRGAHLTPVGSAILPAVRSFAEQLSRLEAAVQDAVAGKIGTLTIGAITSTMLDDLPPLIERLREELPNVTVLVREIDSAKAVPALESGEIDLAFARLKGALGPSISSLPVAQDRLAVALQRHHPMARKEKIKLGSLAPEDFVFFSRAVSPVYFDLLITSCREQGFSPRILYEVRSVASQVASVSIGQGIALVPYGCRRFAPPRVVVLPLEEDVDIVTSTVAWNSLRPNPLVDALIGFVRDAQAQL
jgi:DNA-binding transcriptional LysR family regulator